MEDYDGEERKGHLRSTPSAALLQTHSTSAAQDLLHGKVVKNQKKTYLHLKMSQVSFLKENNKIN